jgi:Predicted signal transduction protein with a C-terminal ATPase domain
MQKKHTPIIKNLSIKTQLIIMVLIIISGLAILSVFSYTSYYQLQLRILENTQNAWLNSITTEINNNYRYIVNLSNNLSYNDSIQNYLSSENSLSEVEFSKSASKQIINAQSIEKYILDIAIVKDKSYYINISGDGSIFPALMENHPDNHGNLFFFDNIEYYVQAQMVDCIVVGRWIYPLDLTKSEPCGALYMTLNPHSFLGSSYFTSSPISDLIITDQHNQLILGDEQLYKGFVESLTTNSEENLSGTSKVGDLRYRYLLSPLEELPYTLISFTEQSAIQNNIFDIIFRQYVSVFITILILLGFLLLFVGNFFSTINHLITIMNRISFGERQALKERFMIKENQIFSQESHMLVTAFNSMLDEINTLNTNIFNSYTKMYETELYAKRAELNFLRSQINPHFVYNTLAVISGMASEERTDEITDVAQSLAEILRYSIKGNEFVTFEQELDIVTSYLTIQTLRFDDRFSIEYQISDDVMNIELPKMILQPIIENAIIHGLEDRLQEGHLLLYASLDKKQKLLIVRVTDNGMGIEHKILEKLKTSILLSSKARVPAATVPDFSLPTQSAASTDELGIGLRNISSRLRLYYETENALSIDSDKKNGTVVEIRIPLKP